MYYAVKHEKVHSDGTAYVRKYVRKIKEHPTTEKTASTEKEKLENCVKKKRSTTEDLFYPKDCTYTHFFTLTFKTEYQDPLREYFLAKEYLEKNHPDIKFTFVVGRTLLDKPTEGADYTNFHIHGMCSDYVDFRDFYSGEYASPKAYNPEETCKKIKNESDYAIKVRYILDHLDSAYRWKRENGVKTQKFPVAYNIGSIRHNKSHIVFTDEEIFFTEEEAIKFLNDEQDFFVVEEAIEFFNNEQDIFERITVFVTKKIIGRLHRKSGRSQKGKSQCFLGGKRHRFTSYKNNIYVQRIRQAFHVKAPPDG